MTARAWRTPIDTSSTNGTSDTNGTNDTNDTNGTSGTDYTSDMSSTGQALSISRAEAVFIINYALGRDDYEVEYPSDMPVFSDNSDPSEVYFAAITGGGGDTRMYRRGGMRVGQEYSIIIVSSIISTTEVIDMEKSKKTHYIYRIF